MSTISKKLRSMGVGIGKDGLKYKPSKPPISGNKRSRFESLEKELNGQVVETKSGSTYLIETIYPEEYQQGDVKLSDSYPLTNLAHWSGHNQIQGMPLQSFAFIDTETTGLSVGTGTYAFLIGIGIFIDNDFHLYQLLMRDPVEETAQLEKLNEILATCQAIVTFNGKTFDVPLLKTRYITHQWPDPFQDYPHIDLLHLARRLWSVRLPSRTLGNLEFQILKTRRSEEDIPGWAIPKIYFDYLSTGDAGPLKRVIYHNAVDIVSLAALFSCINQILSQPTEMKFRDIADYFALGRLFEDIGDLSTATQLYDAYLSGLNKLESGESIDTTLTIKVLMRLGLIYKRDLEFPKAISHWKHAVQYDHLPAYEELAKYYEHKKGDYTAALKWTSSAINLLATPNQINKQDTFLKSFWLPRLEHRRDRLLYKIDRSGVEK